MQDLTPTQTKILDAAKKEFLSKGFSEASVSQIVLLSGVPQETVSQLYPDKACLFDALVHDPAAELIQKLSENQDTYFDLFLTHRTQESSKLFTEFFCSFINFIYDHFDVFKLIMFRSEGSSYQHYMMQIIRMDTARSEEYFGELRRSGRPIRDVSHDLHHMISSAFFTGTFETIAHDMTRQQAVLYVEQLSRFFFRGWEAIIKP